MPDWTATLPVLGLMSGTPVKVWDAESLTDDDASQAVALPPRDELDLTWDIVFGSTPTTVDYRLQVAINNVDAEYYDLGTTITSTAGGKVTVNGVVARFARIHAVDADVETVTAQIMVM
jgi:hypothetical protein